MSTMSWPRYPTLWLGLQQLVHFGSPISKENADSGEMGFLGAARSCRDPRPGWPLKCLVGCTYEQPQTRKPENYLPTRRRRMDAEINVDRENQICCRHVKFTVPHGKRSMEPLDTRPWSCNMLQDASDSDISELLRLPSPHSDHCYCHGKDSRMPVEHGRLATKFLHNVSWHAKYTAWTGPLIHETPFSTSTGPITSHIAQAERIKVGKAPV